MQGDNRSRPIAGLQHTGALPGEYPIRSDSFFPQRSEESQSGGIVFLLFHPRLMAVLSPRAPPIRPVFCILPPQKSAVGLETRQHPRLSDRGCIIENMMISYSVFSEIRSFLYIPLWKKTLCPFGDVGKSEKIATLRNTASPNSQSVAPPGISTCWSTTRVTALSTRLLYLRRLCAWMLGTGPRR